jgi:hypothetical protein
LNIKIFVENGNLIIENNLQTRELPNKSTGVGLANIVSRYNLLTDRNVFVEKSEDFFRVKLPILKEKIKAMNTFRHQKNKWLTKKQQKSRRTERFLRKSNLILCFHSVFFFINWRTNPSYWWAFWPMLGWGIGVASHAFKTFGIGKIGKKDRSKIHGKRR